MELCPSPASHLSSVLGRRPHTQTFAMGWSRCCCFSYLQWLWHCLLQTDLFSGSREGPESKDVTLMSATTVTEHTLPQFMVPSTAPLPRAPLSIDGSEGGLSSSGAAKHCWAWGRCIPGGAGQQLCHRLLAPCGGWLWYSRWGVSISSRDGADGEEVSLPCSGEQWRKPNACCTGGGRAVLPTCSTCP